MKQKLKILFAITATAIIFAGCTSTNPNYNPAQPPTASGGTNPEYVPVVPQTVSNVVGTVQKINAAIPTPYQEPIQEGTNFFLWGFAAISGLVAGIQNRKLAAQKSATQTLANVVVGAGGAQVALQNAANETQAGIIAGHIQNAPLPMAAPPKPA